VEEKVALDRAQQSARRPAPDRRADRVDATGVLAREVRARLAAVARRARVAVFAVEEPRPRRERVQLGLHRVVSAQRRERRDLVEQQPHPRVEHGERELVAGGDVESRARERRGDRRRPAHRVGDRPARG
jgi:hypothetical protein